MALKDRIRAAIRTDRSSSSESSSNPGSRPETANATPSASAGPTPTVSPRESSSNIPTITLTKTHTSRLSLTRSLTWSKGGKSKEEKMAEKQQKRLDTWAQKDRDEWSTPEDGWRRVKEGDKGNKRCKQHQDLLRQFEFKDTPRRRSVSSWISGISPRQSRVGSLEDSLDAPQSRKKGSGAGLGSSLSREVTRQDGEGLRP